MPANQFIIIKPNVLQDKNLTATDKLILGYIYSFLAGGSVVYASNNEIADFLGLSRSQVLRSIKKLHQLGYYSITHTRQLNMPGNDVRIIDKKADNYDILMKALELLNK